MANIYHHRTLAELQELAVVFNASVDVTQFMTSNLAFLSPTYVPPYGGDAFLAIVIISSTFTFAAGCSRLWIRHRSIGLKLDDWLCLAALIGFTAMTILAILGVFVGGLGYHIYDMTAYRIDMCYLIVQIYTIFAIVTLCISRLSILCLVRRTFGKSSPITKWSTDFLIAGSLVTAILTTALTVLVCQPMIANFRIVARMKYRCHYPWSRVYVFGIVNTGLDLLVLLLPVHNILTLKAPLKDRLRLLLLFWLGILASLCSLFRILSYQALKESAGDINWICTRIVAWCHLEAAIAIIISSIPSFHKQLITVFSIFHIPLFASSLKSSPSSSSSGSHVSSSHIFSPSPTSVTKKTDTNNNNNDNNNNIDLEILSSPRTHTSFDTFQSHELLVSTTVVGQVKNVDSMIHTTGLTSAVGSYVGGSNTGTHQRVRRRSSVFYDGEEHVEEEREKEEEEEEEHEEYDDHKDKRYGHEYENDVVSNTNTNTNTNIMMSGRASKQMDHGVSKRYDGISMV